MLQKEKQTKKKTLLLDDQQAFGKNQADNG